MKLFKPLGFALFLFNVGACTAQYATLYDFDFFGLTGSYPQGTLTISGDTLFGVTKLGGPTSVGNIFRVKTDGTGYKDIYDFSGTDGQNPTGSLVLIGNVLYGITRNGGALNGGNIFSIHTDGKGFKDLHDFGGPDGAFANGGLTLSGNLFYGVTSWGGQYNSGTVFSIHTDGTGFKKMTDLGYSNTGTLKLSGRTLFGMSTDLNSMGSILAFYLDSTRNDSITRWIQLHVFSLYDGGAPYGSLTISGRTLFGMTTKGGNIVGGVFSVDSTGNGFKVLGNDFNGVPPHPSTAYGDVLLSGKTLYGMTSKGGANDGGLIFSIDTDATGFTDIFDFNPVCISSPGCSPMGSLILSKGVLYGVTESGGQYSKGTILKFDLGPGSAGIGEMNNPEASVTLYPNPSKDQFVIEAKTNERQIVQIFDMEGNLLKSQTIQGGKVEIDTYDLSPAVYMVCITSGRFKINKKLVIIH